MTSILEPGRNTWRTASADAYGVVIDAADYYYDFYETARQAKHYILMSGWQFDHTNCRVPGSCTLSLTRMGGS